MIDCYTLYHKKKSVHLYPLIQGELYPGFHLGRGFKNELTNLVTKISCFLIFQTFMSRGWNPQTTHPQPETIQNPVLNCMHLSINCML
jgi:hypothetical protein